MTKLLHHACFVIFVPRRDFRTHRTHRTRATQQPYSAQRGSFAASVCGHVKKETLRFLGFASLIMDYVSGPTTK